ncbi:isopentenyl transferase family protein [Nostoc sp. XA010]|uniref:isopentenyl transferase family protein n=1 Tax=Nostoc sp. XA010 TaxID=2780407 RepID=UPI001E411E85|nr:isopentenyl transferase family protein [Nostoc sp. XA010]MCC5659137.1 isopentenyl transferase family protein [Nostoc sp. XA010]
MQLHIILGSTSVGKTARSIMLAKQTKAPVIVLDRIQIYQELATGSGRPLIDELEGTTRTYLEERQVVDGELTTVESLSLTLQIINKLSLRHNLLLLEGGSISLCTALFKSGILDNYQTTIEYLTIQNEAAYCNRLWSRMQDALISRPGQPSLLEELDRVWLDPRKLAFVRTVLGFDILVDWCQRFGLSPYEMWNTVQEDSLKVELIGQMFSAYLQYSRDQRRAFDRLVVEYEQRRAFPRTKVGANERSV